MNKPVSEAVVLDGVDIQPSTLSDEYAQKM